MAITTVDLFRMGDQTSARLDHVRPLDIVHFLKNADPWVRAGSGGVSTFEVPGRSGLRWWRLPAGYDPGGLLVLWNDYHKHWSWEPAQDMRLDQFTQELSLANRFFR